MILSLDLIRPRKAIIDVVGGGVEGGRNMLGFNSAIDFTGGGVITCRYQLNPTNANPYALRYISRLGAMLNSGVRTIDVPLLVDWVLPVVTGNPTTLYAEDVFHDDDAPFDDGSGYGQDVLFGEIAADAALNAGTIQIRMFAAGDLIGGEFFSIDHLARGPRAYRISDIDSRTVETNAVLYAVAIRPTLREAVTVGQYVRFVRPRFRARFAPGFTLPIDIEKFWKFSGEIAFVEAA